MLIVSFFYCLFFYFVIASETKLLFFLTFSSLETIFYSSWEVEDWGSIDREAKNSCNAGKDSMNRCC